jgi:pimeloyl-ACP methyl ester carboxylesterase
MAVVGIVLRVVAEAIDQEGGGGAERILTRSPLAESGGCLSIVCASLRAVPLIASGCDHGWLSRHAGCRGSAMMARSIYRSDAGRDAIRAWCEMRLQGIGATSRDLDTALGTTRIATVGDGPDVVLLPGTNFSTVTSLELLALVGREHRAIGIDLPGQPGLSAGERPRDRDAYGPWLRELVDALALERPTVVGHSLAGRVALLAARGNPAIGSLVLVNPGGLIRLRVGPRGARGDGSLARPPR